MEAKATSYWFPGLAAGMLSWAAFVTLGQTPMIRATALALVVVGITMSLRRSGTALAIIGGLALALSPAFWSQTGPAEDLSLIMTLAILGISGAITLLIILRFRENWLLALIIGFASFAVLLWSQLATLGSLRITTLSAAWLLYLLIDGLYLTNPHPDDPPTGDVQPRHTLGVLILLAVGVINAPPFILLAPAVIVGLILYRKPLPRWYWGLLLLIVMYGLYGIASTYLSSTWWVYPAARAEAAGIRVPYMFADGWREASRWVMLVNLVIGQFTILGVILGIMGLSRLARWYPPLGAVTMIAYAGHALFGLVYFGKDNAVLLLPLLMIQIFWMTYAVYALGQWLQRSLKRQQRLLGWSVPIVYLLLPLLMLSRIAGTV